MHNHVLKDLKNTVAKFPDKPAFCGEKSVLTFKQLDESIDRIGTYILRQGIKKSPIVVYMEKSPEEVAESSEPDPTMCRSMRRCRRYVSILFSRM